VNRPTTTRLAGLAASFSNGHFSTGNRSTQTA
jgi:hypothetical protein